MTHLVVSSLSGGHKESITALALSASDQTLASGSDDHTICLWSPAQSQSPIQKLSVQAPCTAIQFSQTKTDLIYTAQGCNICTYDVRSFSQPLLMCCVSEEEINSIDILESEAKLATGDDTGSIKIVSTDTGEVIRSLKKHDNICSCVKFRPNRTWQLISGGLDCRLMVSDWKETGRGVAIFEMNELLGFPEDDDEEEEEEADQDEQDYNEHEDAAAETAGHNDGDEDEDADSYTSTRDSTTAEESNPFITRRQSDASDDGEDIQANGHRVRIHDSQGEHFMASAMSTGWSQSVGGVQSSAMPVNPPLIHSLASTKSGSLIAVGLASSSVELFTGTAKHLTHTESLYGHSRGVSALKILHNDQFLISGSNDKSLFLWPITTGSGSDDRNGTSGSQVEHSEKIEALAGSQLNRVYVADSGTSPIVYVMDFTLC